MKNIFLLTLLLSLPTQARMVDPSTLVENSDVEKVDHEVKEIVKNLKKRSKLALKNGSEGLPEKKVIENTMPQYAFDETENSARELENAKNDFKSKEVFKVSSKGRSADPSLKKSKDGVPLFSLFNKKKYKDKKGKTKYRYLKIAQIPEIDIGEESSISSEDLLLKDLKVIKPNYLSPEPLESPSKVSKRDLAAWKKKIKVNRGPRGLKRKDYGLGALVTERTLDKAIPKYNLDHEVNLLDVKKFTHNHLKMLAAKIIYAKGKKCHAVSGLFNDLSKVSEFKYEANFFLGVCAHKMGFYTESVNRLVKVILEEDPFYTTEAVKVITNHLPREYEIKVAKAILGVKNKSLLPKDSMDNVNYVLAKGYVNQRKYHLASKYAAYVSTKSDKYPKAMFIKGISQYSLGHDLKAIETLKLARRDVRSRSGDYDNLESLISVNLARINFQVRKFSASNSEYLQVKKDSPYWIQALVEQGWAQLMMNDPSGAIGNMYSLHSPYFKSVYKPESYAVRTIGYLDICQYGDAYQTLKLMEERYRPWIQSVNIYIKSQKSFKNYYKTLKKYLLGHSQKDVDGVPYQVLREIARKRNFLNYQDSINNKVDEVEQYSFIKKMMGEDVAKLKWRIKKAKNRINLINKNLVKAKKDKSLAPKMVQWKGKRNHERDLIRNLTFQIAMYGQNIKGFKKLEKVAKRRIASEKATLKNMASKVLRANLLVAKKQMQKILNNNELLRFEVFSGSGENIRYRVGGGSTSKSSRVPASYKPQKTLKWSVIGEYWADEIGKYRSALKNNCPKKARMPKMRAKLK